MADEKDLMSGERAAALLLQLLLENDPEAYLGDEEDIQRGGVTIDGSFDLAAVCQNFLQIVNAQPTA